MTVKWEETLLEAPEANSLLGPLVGWKQVVSSYTPRDLQGLTPWWRRHHVTQRRAISGYQGNGRWHEITRLSLVTPQPLHSIRVLVSFSALKRGRRKMWFSSGAILHTTDIAPVETMASTAKSSSARSELGPLQRAVADPEGSRVHSCRKRPQQGRTWEKLENRWHPLKRSQENDHLHDKAWRPTPPLPGSRIGTPGWLPIFELSAQSAYCSLADCLGRSLVCF